MTTKTRPQGVFAWLSAAAMALCLAGEAHAQNATITGRVTNAEGAPIQGANVLIPTLNLGTVTGQNGTYSFNVPESQANGQRVSLTARFIGFSPVTRQITLSAGSQTQDFSLKADPFRLDEVVVTGTTGEMSAKKLSISVGRVTEEQLKEVPASSPISALQGKISGVRVASGVGNPGGAPTIRLRGSTALGVGGNSPMIIVDGVVTQNSISDIDANDIESIEVLKGAAAASYYGSNAANGVVQIVTKRGRDVPDNKVSFSSRSEYGKSSLENFVPLARHHAYALNPDGTIQMNGDSRVQDPDGIADNPYPAGPNGFRDQLKTWMNDGQFYQSNLQLGMRRGNTNFNTSYTYDKNQGVLPLTKGQYRQNVRLNVDQGLGVKADLSASLTYGIRKNDYDPDGSAGWFALLQAPPDVDLRRPFGDDSIAYHAALPAGTSPSDRGNPLYQLVTEDYNERRERMLGSLSMRYRPWEWMRLEASYGTDRLNYRDRTYRPRGYKSTDGSPTNGLLDIDTFNNQSENTQLTATVTKMLFNSISSTTRGSYLLEKIENTVLEADGDKFAVTEVPDLAGLDPSNNSINSGLVTERTQNYLVSQALDIKDRYIVDFLYRRDGSSLFGPNERWQDFYRVSGAYRITEDFTIPGIQELKIRAARGTAGLRPGFADQYETYTLDDGRFSKFQLGNKDLKPAIQTEDEFGLNVQFLNRFDLELVNAQRTTEGAFLRVPLSVAAGGYTDQWQNAADVSAKTFEVALNTRVIDRPDFSYSFTITGDHTSQRIDRLDRAPFRVNAGGQGQDVFYYKAGEDLGIIYGTKWVRSFAELKANPANAAAVESDYVVNPAGYLVLAAQRGLPTERPIRFVDAAGNNQHKIGDVNPDFSFGFANNVRYKGLSLYALLDGVRGGDIYNFTKQWMYQDQRHGTQDQAGRPDDQKIALAFFSAGMYNGLVANDHFVEDGSYVRLRELSLGYTFSPAMMDRLMVSRIAKGLKVALIGRNLLTWTDYTGFDPEVTSGNDFNFKIDGFRYPNFRQITGQIEINF